LFWAAAAAAAAAGDQAHNNGMEHIFRVSENKKRGGNPNFMILFAADSPSFRPSLPPDDQYPAQKMRVISSSSSC
jgi:hypothetical protein